MVADSEACTDTQRSYSHARLPIKIKGSFSLSLFFPSAATAAPGKYTAFFSRLVTPLKCMHLTSISRNLALPFLFADTMLFLSSNFGHILRSIDTAVRVSTITERRERRMDQGCWNNRVSFLFLPRKENNHSLYHVFHSILGSARLPLCSSSLPILSVRTDGWIHATRRCAIRLRRISGGRRNNGRRAFRLQVCRDVPGRSPKYVHRWKDLVLS